MPRTLTAEETAQMLERYDKAQLEGYRKLVAMLPDGMPLAASLIDRIGELMGKVEE